jgi:hemin uptake protein HemP
MDRPAKVERMSAKTKTGDEMTQATIETEAAPLQARDLTGGASTAKIELDGQTYTLRITRQNKLILTK